MSVSIFYQAIPVQSALYSRLQQDRAFNTLFVELFTSGCGVLHLLAFDPEAAEEIIEQAVDRYPDTLGTDTEERIAEFRAVLEQTRKDYPGIELQTASLEKSSADVQERLTARLAPIRHDAATWIEHLMFGDRQFAPHMRAPEEDVLSIVSLEVMKEGADVLKLLKPEDLFDRDGDWEACCRNDYSRWRELYLAAAERNEEIVVGVA